MNKEKCFYIIQDDDDEIQVGTKADIDLAISIIESKNQDMDFKTIGQIPIKGLTIDFSSDLIEWYNKETKPEKRIIDAAVLKIIEKLRNTYA